MKFQSPSVLTISSTVSATNIIGMLLLLVPELLMTILSKMDSLIFTSNFPSA